MGIDVIDGYISDPGDVPGDVQHAGDADVAEVKDGVRGAFSGHFLGRPADNVRIEFAGGLCVAGHEFVPAEFSFWRKHCRTSPCWWTQHRDEHSVALSR